MFFNSFDLAWFLDIPGTLASHYCKTYIYIYVVEVRMCTLDYNDYYDFSIRTQSTHIRSTQRYPGLGGYPLQLMVHLQQYLFLS